MIVLVGRALHDNGLGSWLHAFRYRQSSATCTALSSSALRNVSVSRTEVRRNLAGAVLAYIDFSRAVKTVGIHEEWGMARIDQQVRFARLSKNADRHRQTLYRS